MATFNTAFGSLPTPEKELFGNAATQRGQKRGTGQIEQGIAPGAMMNFAELQKNGIARPAPPSAQAAAPPPMLTSLQDQLRQPVAAPTPPEVRTTVPTPPPMLSALQTSLTPETTPEGEMATTSVSPVPTPATTPATTPITPTIATNTMTGPPGLDTTGDFQSGGDGPNLGGGAGEPEVRGRDEVGGPDYIQGRPDRTTPPPITPLTTYQAGAPVPRDAADGATFQAANGTIWTKRGGIWGQNAGQANLSGYAGLIPAEIIAGNRGEGPIGGGGGYTASGLDNFLRTHGTPRNPAEFASLAENSGMTVPQLQAFINRYGPQDPLRYESQQTLSDRQEQIAWMSDPANRSQLDAWGGLGWNMAFVPKSQGGPKLRRKTYDEVVAAGYTPYGGRELYDNPDLNKNLGGGEGGMGTGGGGPATGGGYTGGGYTGGGVTGGGTPGTVSYQPTGTGTAGLPDITTLLARLNGTLTTGGGTPATAGTPAYAGSPQAMALRQQLEAQLAKLAGGDDAQRKAFEATRAARGAELTAQYGAERSKLEEELAARGLSASTIGGGRYGDLAGQQARATASFEAEMLKQQSEAEARDRALYMSTMSDLAGLAGTQDLGAYEANLKTKQIESDIAFRAAELQQEAALKGRELTLQEARDRATAQYQSGQLGLGYAEMRSREQMQREDQTFRQGESALERQLRLTLQTNDLAAAKTQGDLDRALQREVNNNTMTINQANYYRQLVAGIWDGTIPIEAWETLLLSAGLDPKKYPKPQARSNAGGGGGGGGSGGGGGGGGGGVGGDGDKF